MLNIMPSKLFLRKYLLSSVLMISGMFFTLNFFALGCVIDLFEQLKFAFGAFIYCIGTLIFLAKEKLTLKNTCSQLVIFLLLNILCILISYTLKSLFLMTIYFND